MNLHSIPPPGLFFGTDGRGRLKDESEPQSLGRTVSRTLEMLPTCLMYVSLSLVAANPAEASWSGFRGPLSASVHSNQLPLTWSPSENIAWQAKIEGYGQSSPVVWNNHVYVTSVVGPNKEICRLSAFDLTTGKPLWQKQVANATPQESSNYISKAAPTPVVDEAGIVALFEGGNLIAVDNDGNDRWQWNLVEKFGPIKTRHGLGSSLAQDAELVFVWIERMEDPYLLAVDKESGEQKWKVEGLKAASWSTPVLLAVQGSQHLVLAGSGLARGHDPKTGEILWSLSGISGNTTPSPQPVGDGQFLLGASSGRGEGGGGKSSPSNALVKVERNSEGKFTANVAWKAKNAGCSFGSPIAHQGLAYYVNATGVLFCLDAQSGEQVYSHRLGDSIWATPLAVDDRIYFVGHKGTTTVVQAGREFLQLAQNRLWPEEAKEAEKKPPAEGEKSGGAPRAEGDSPAGILYAVAAVPGKLLIRRGDVLYCVSNAQTANASTK